MLGSHARGRNEFYTRYQVRAGDCWGTCDSAKPGWCPARFDEGMRSGDAQQDRKLS